MDSLASRKNLFSAYLAVSSALAAYAIYGVLWSKPNLYAAGIELSKGFPLVILTNWLIGWSILIGKLLQELMFGELRLIEIEHLYERSWYTVTNLIMTLAMFRSQNNLLIFGMILSLLFLKIFHWILGDRLDYLFQQQQLSDYNGVKKVILNRTTAVLGIFLVLDYKVISTCIDHAFLHSTDVFVVFGLDFLMVYLELLEATLKYTMNVGEIIYLRYRPDDEIWEDKAWISKVGMIAISFFRLVAVGFVFVGLIYAYIIPVNFTRDVYIGVVKLVKQLKDLFYLIKAARDLDTHITDATDDDLIDQEMCIICRDDMTTDVPSKRHRNAPKKLPCGHVLHFGCLKSWLERSHCCPTCRREVFSDNRGTLPEWTHHHHGVHEEGEAMLNTGTVGGDTTRGNPHHTRGPREPQEPQEAPVTPLAPEGTPTTTTTNTSDFSIRLPSDSIIPTDWTILPMERTNKPNQYNVRLNRETTCNLRVVKRDRIMNREEFEQYVVRH
ncbi:hypothetical protein FOA43_003745 [Brettanomyces nanus]|uniref:RING-type E3 ubiquitin transferase n=1 Tax=Eeniella nana TaxID=13502 RepID=A0A875RWK5_EENNA|nr:uncharacterized protein FOA43_003745 [Brettanomyces nanus]QPG76357.1 hypothetical protein FOA43_003745 [Brettanomyces nanus]